MSIFRRNLIAKSLNAQEGIKPCIFRVNNPSEDVLLASYTDCVKRIYLGTGEEIEFAQGDYDIYHTFAQPGDYEVYYELDPGAKSAEVLFARCLNLISVPNTFFKDVPDLTSVSGTFAQCQNLTTVQEGIFKYTKYLSDFSSCFMYCMSLQGETPKNFEGGNLWEGTSVVPENEIVGDNCFIFCQNLSDYGDIPELWRGYM